MSNSLTTATKLLKLETEISKQAGEINQRLTSTQVESAITGKGYQTKSQVDSNITLVVTKPSHRLIPTSLVEAIRLRRKWTPILLAVTM